jgi:hypothetical protein
VCAPNLTDPFRHYDALVSLGDQLSPGSGLEHLEEGENNLPPNYFTASGQQLSNRDLVAHEYEVLNHQPDRLAAQLGKNVPFVRQMLIDQAWV